MKQDHGQPIRSFAAQVKGKAKTCSFVKDCTRTGCSTVVDFTDEIVKYVVISGVTDDDIKRDILSHSDIDAKSLNDTVSLIEGKEMAVRAMSAKVSEHLSAVAFNKPTSSDTQEKLTMKTTCKTCNREMLRYTMFRSKGKSNLKEFNLCKECWFNKSKPPRRSSRQSNQDQTTGALFDEMSAISDRSVDLTASPDVIDLISPVSSVALDHHIFDGTGKWKTAESKKQPSLELSLSVNADDYKQVGVFSPDVIPSQVTVITDTGAQSSLMGLNILLNCGFKESHLIPVRKKMYIDENIDILGAILLRLSGFDNLGNRIEAAEMVYVSNSTKLFYLSRQAMEQLRIIGPNFPIVGSVSSEDIGGISLLPLLSFLPEGPCSTQRAPF